MQTPIERKLFTMTLLIEELPGFFRKEETKSTYSLRPRIGAWKNGRIIQVQTRCTHSEAQELAHLK